MAFFRSVVVLLLTALLTGSSCQPDDVPLLPESRYTVSGESGLQLLARFVQVTDTHIIDEESPARFPGAYDIISSAYRPWESYSTQILDGIIRVVNRIHASGRPVNFLVHTGDACDNAQSNEFRWFMTLMDGGWVNPLSGPDDRPPERRPDPRLDPHAAFQAQGLYQQGLHGDLPSIPWYALLGNHDVYSIGVFPIVTNWCGRRVAPLPLPVRPGIYVPHVFDPVGRWAWGRVTPADPGPPALFALPVPIETVPDRAYFTRQEFITALQASPTPPAGHGPAPEGGPWYSVSPLPGLRLLVLFTSDQADPVPGVPNHEGCVSAGQLDWLTTELKAAFDRGEVVVVASHHPTSSLETLYGSAADPAAFRDLLNAHPSVVLHLAGHYHRHRVALRGNYIEMETCSTIDAPQEARLIEIWREQPAGSILVGYETFSHLDDTLPPLGDDPLVDLRRQALDMASAAAATPEARPVDSAGSESDRTGMIRLHRR